MILQSLVQYYEALEKRGEVERPGWCKAKVSFSLVLSLEGELKRVIPLKIPVTKGKKEIWEPQLLKVPEMLTRTSGTASNFLCDNSSYLLGIDQKGNPARSKECFLCAKEKHQQILAGVDSSVALAVCRFFDRWDPDGASSHPALIEKLEDTTAGGNLIFEVAGSYAQEDASIQTAWEAYLAQEEKGQEGICLVTGQRTEIARIHGYIRGVQGAQSSGAALVSFNAPAFESYGKEQSFNAPVGEYAVYAYTTALNYLIRENGHKTALTDSIWMPKKEGQEKKKPVYGDTTVVYWSEKGDQESQDLFENMMEPSADNEEIIHGVFQNLMLGRAVNVSVVEQSIDLRQKFYILGLAPNAARIATRFFYQNGFGAILQNLKDHYDRLEIVRPNFDKIQYLGVWNLLLEIANKKSKDKKPPSNLAGAVYRSIISGDRYPSGLYQAVLERIWAERGEKAQISRGRAAIIKAYLLQNSSIDKEEITVALNEESKSIPYTLGRLFAVLEEIQEMANPDINSTIRDRYFNSACMTPAYVFPTLIKLAQSHIKKINSKDKNKVDKYKVQLKQLSEIIPPPIEQNDTTIPRRLNQEEQGMFILGYYHQTQKRYEKKEKGDTTNE